MSLPEMQPPANGHAFAPAAKRGVYEAIFRRRDIRAEFLPDPIPDAVLARLLLAAHHSASVGFMQPWNFLVIRSQAVKEKVRAIFTREHLRAARLYRGTRRRKNLSLKLEGILEAPLNICVTCDPERGGPHVLGRNTMKETDLFSTSCAVENLWLAARAEGIGMGWVSILDNRALARVLGMPRRILLVAYLCLGYVSRFPVSPMLEACGWRSRISLGKLIFFDRWGRTERKGLSAMKRSWKRAYKELLP